MRAMWIPLWQWGGLVQATALTHFGWCTQPTIYDHRTKMNFQNLNQFITRIYVKIARSQDTRVRVLASFKCQGRPLLCKCHQITRNVKNCLERKCTCVATFTCIRISDYTRTKQNNFVLYFRQTKMIFSKYFLEVFFVGLFFLQKRSCMQLT